MKGFTLIETLVAVMLLSLAIAGPLTIASKSLNATLVSKDQFIAFYLAQDAIEQVRYLRDTSALCLAAGSSSGSCAGVTDWLSRLALCVSVDGCKIDTVQDTVTSCVGACTTLNYDAANHYYSYTSGSLSPQRFIRTIKITNTVADEAVVTVTVSWSDLAGVTHLPVTVRENIFRWQ